MQVESKRIALLSIAIVIISACLAVGIPAEAEADDGTVVYLDPANGSDTNYGATVDTALKTLEAAKDAAGTDGRIVVCSTIEVKGDENALIEGVHLVRNDGFKGYLIQVFYGKEVTIRDSIIDGNHVDADKSLVHAGQGTINIEEGTVICNSTTTAVTVYNGGAVLNMNGGAIRDNVSDTYGGGVFAYNAKVNLNGGEITGNTTTESGGGVCAVGSNVTLSGTSVVGNTSTSTEDTCITGAYAYYAGGGGIYVEGNSIRDASLTMTGGEISGNKASSDGGAIMIGVSSRAETVVTITGGTISGNQAPNGSALNIDYGEDRNVPELHLGGSPEIEGDVRLFGYDDSWPCITVDGDFSPANPVNLQIGEIGDMPAVVYTDGSPDLSCFTIDGYSDLVVRDNGIYVDSDVYVYLDPDSGDDSNDGKSRDSAVASLDRALELDRKVVVICSEVEIEGEDRVIDGKVFQRDDSYSGRLFYVTYGDSLTLTNTTIDGMGVEAEGALIHTQQGEVNIGDGTVLRNNGFTAITMNRADLNMTGGTITGNSSASDGGAIYAMASDIILSGGTIEGNTTAESGGAVCALGSKVVISGTVIRDNESKGTGVSTVLGTVSAMPGGGAVYVETNSQGNGSFTMTGGTITGNTAAGKGAAVYVYNSNMYATSTSVSISGGVIDGNTSDDGFSVLIDFKDGVRYEPTLELSGSPTISAGIRLGTDDSRFVGITAGDLTTETPIEISYETAPAAGATVVKASGSEGFDAGSLSFEGYRLYQYAEGDYRLAEITESDDGTNVSESTDSEGNRTTVQESETVGDDGMKEVEVTTTTERTDGTKVTESTGTKTDADGNVVSKTSSRTVTDEEGNSQTESTSVVRDYNGVTETVTTTTTKADGTSTSVSSSVFKGTDGTEVVTETTSETGADGNGTSESESKVTVGNAGLTGAAAGVMSATDDDEIEVVAQEGIDSVKIASDAMKVLSEKGKGIVVITSDATVSLTKEVLAGEENDIVISSETVDGSSDLTEAQREAIGDNTAFILRASGADGYTFRGTVSVTVDFTMPADSIGIKVYYVDTDGNREDVTASYNAGKVTFWTDHFSVYMIEPQAAAVPEPEPEPEPNPDTPHDPVYDDDDGPVFVPVGPSVSEDDDDGLLTMIAVAGAALVVVLIAVCAMSLRRN